MAGDRAVSDVVQDILDNVQELLRAEVRLAKAEVRRTPGRPPSPAYG